MNIKSYPKSTAAVLLASSAAAALWWVLRDPKRIAALRQRLSARADAYRNARSKRAA